MVKTKIHLIAILALITIISANTASFAAVPAYNETNTKGTIIDGSLIVPTEPNVTEKSVENSKVVGFVTFTFAGSGVEHPERAVTTSVIEEKPLSDDEVMEKELRGLTKVGNQGDILHIDAIDGVPIAETKWASYGGNIPVTKPYLGGRNPDGLPIKDAKGNILYNGFFVTSNAYVGNSGFWKAYYDAGYRDNESINKKYGGDISITQPVVISPSDVTVVVNNEPVYFMDAKPYIDAIAGRTLVPMRAVFEHHWVQCTVLWDGTNRMVTATNRDGRTIIFTIDDKIMTIIDKQGKVTKIENDVAPTIKDGRTYLPLRAMTEALSLKVDWKEDTYVVDIQGNDAYNTKLMSRKDWGAYFVKYNAQHPN
ncbi:copper amine oxidase N-terminal domain-containing protein [Paenibacillus agricola]|uniref:Copper amine oxidase N-terminal domain-containing protein n=1 Tax=Paenibacillus agricola TaxID=2716264 RepID=A0ABX0JH51_9BACL|nr:copper amine oxidase N-terminal domain-containing protein [Paenibacillus agricola]NHN34878.1 copper amine oxidase N-terminal domain-containing protein [Paenibacillus agricola]